MDPILLEIHKNLPQKLQNWWLKELKAHRKGNKQRLAGDMATGGI